MLQQVQQESRPPRALLPRVGAAEKSGVTTALSPKPPPLLWGCHREGASQQRVCMCMCVCMCACTCVCVHVCARMHVSV